MKFGNFLRLAGIIILVILAGLLWFGARNFASRRPGPLAPKIKMEKVTLQTKDGFMIAADYYPAAATAKGVLLIHMMPATKESWRDFASKLVADGYQALAIDLRGHGESTGGPKGYQRFTDVEHRSSINDVAAGAEFLASKGVKELTLIGASIGANLALEYAAENHEVKRAVLLSPGLDYRGIATEPLMARLTAGQAVLLVGSDNDSQSDSSVIRRIASAAAAGVKTDELIYKSAGHGTDMFGKESPDLAQAILKWLAK